MFRIARCNFSNRPKKKARKNVLASYFKFYLRKSSIHSFSYIGSDVSWLEKLFWLSMFAFSMTGCVLMTKNLYKKLNFKAITLNVDDKAVEVAEVPFPAITIFGRYPNPLHLGRYPDVHKNLDLLQRMQEPTTYWKLYLEYVIHSKKSENQ